MIYQIKLTAILTDGEPELLRTVAAMNDQTVEAYLAERLPEWISRYCGGNASLEVTAFDVARLQR